MACVFCASHAPHSGTHGKRRRGMGIAPEPWHACSVCERAAAAWVCRGLWRRNPPSPPKRSARASHWLHPLTAVSFARYGDACCAWCASGAARDKGRQREPAVRAAGCSCCRLDVPLRRGSHDVHPESYVGGVRGPPPASAASLAERGSHDVRERGVQSGASVR